MDEAKPFKIPKREIWEAFKRVKANQGAAGVTYAAQIELRLGDLAGEHLDVSAGVPPRDLICESFHLFTKRLFRPCGEAQTVAERIFCGTATAMGGFRPGANPSIRAVGFNLAVARQATIFPSGAVSITSNSLGAALTYARRYALFALVGIAGEDDLDAPDLLPPEQPVSKHDEPNRTGNSRLNGGRQHSPQRAGGHRVHTAHSRSAEQVLEPEASAVLRDRLVTELEDQSTGDDAAVWAHRSLPEKNKLTPADAQHVEEAFQAKITTCAVPTVDQPETTRELEQASMPPASRPTRLPSRARERRIDKSRLSLPEPRRIRDRDHVKYVAQQPCLVCGRSPSDAHHLRFAQPPALGRKVSDEFTVPLCRGHHREVHRCGDEAAWWAKTKINPRVIARVLWRGTRPLPD